MPPKDKPGRSLACAQTVPRIPTGIAGLDETCRGGLPVHSACLLQGGPGSGKTTLGLQFLAAGTARGETGLFISFGERGERIRRNAPSQLDVSDVIILDLSPTAAAFSDDEAYDVFTSAEVEGEPVMDQVRQAVEAHKPARVVVDSMTHLQYLAPDRYQYRKRALGLVRYLADNEVTALFISETTAPDSDDELAFISDGVIRLYNAGDVRRLEVTKLRGSGIQPGPHTVKLGEDGMTVHPRVWPGQHGRAFDAEPIGSGIANLDRLLGGGLHRGTTTVISGPSGVGKSTLGVQFMKEAAARDERSVILSFEEARDTLLQRTRKINIPVDGMVEHGLLAIHKIEPKTASVEEISSLLRKEVEDHGAKVVMLDSAAGFRQAMKADEVLLARLHDICTYLSNMGLTVFVIDEIEQLNGGNTATDVGFSYLTDNAILLRYYDDGGQLARSISILKKRTGDFERTPRRYAITSYGLDVGEPLDNLAGILGAT